jgi:hypothetical protein
MRSGIFNGGEAQTKERMKQCRNGEMMCREFELYASNKEVVCPACFWSLLYRNLPASMRDAGQTREDDSIRGLWVYCKREEIEEDRSMVRLGKQKTEPIKRYAFLAEECEEDGYDSRVIFLYETDSGKKLADKEIKRRLPDNVRYVHMREVTYVDVDFVTKHEDMQGHWI